MNVGMNHLYKWDVKVAIVALTNVNFFNATLRVLKIIERKNCQVGMS